MVYLIYWLLYIRLFDNLVLLLLVWWVWREGFIKTKDEIAWSRWLPNYHHPTQPSCTGLIMFWMFYISRHCHWCRRTNWIHLTGLTDVVLWVLISSSPGQLQIRLLTEISSGIISCLTDNCKIWSLLFGSHLDWPVRFLHQMVSLFKNKFPFLLLFFRRTKCKI